MQETFEKEKARRQIEREKNSQKNISLEKMSDSKITEDSGLESKTGREQTETDNNQEIKSVSENQLGENELPDLEERESEVKERLGLNDSSQSVEDSSKSVGDDRTERNSESAMESDTARSNEIDSDIIEKRSNEPCPDSSEKHSSEPDSDTLEKHSSEPCPDISEKRSSEPDSDIIEKLSSEPDPDIQASESVADRTNVKHSKLHLLEPDIPHLSAVPRLSGGPDAEISLDDWAGVQKLMGRFMDHSKKRAKHINKDVAIK
jgi:hypothetical protein